MVEVFKTNVLKEYQALGLLEQLQHHFPDGFLNFDLADCDHILRIEAGHIHPDVVVNVLQQQGFACEVLDE